MIYFIIKYCTFLYFETVVKWRHK